MDPVLPTIEEEMKRRRRRPLFRHARVPVRMLVPNFFTLLGLCAGLTSIRMGIEGRYDLALAAIVFAAALDGIDGRIARALKASSRFGAELDSLADFVNFGVAPAFLVFNWGLVDLKSAGWICVMIFALASALRLARFNAAIDDDKPKWQSNYFTGMPTPAAAIVVMLPLYIYNLGFEGLKSPLAPQVRDDLHALHRLHAGLHHPDLLGQAPGRTSRARMGAADFHSRHRLRRHAVLVSLRDACRLDAGLSRHGAGELEAVPGQGRAVARSRGGRDHDVRSTAPDAADAKSAPAASEGATAETAQPPQGAATPSPQGAARIYPLRPGDPQR